MPLSPAEQLAHSTVRIECDLAGGGVGTGTGFFYSLDRNENQHIPVIVTNKHVVEGAVKGRFLLTLRNGDDEPAIGKVQAYELDSFQNRWLPHPDSDVDLCVMPIAPLLHEAEETNTKFFFSALDKNMIPAASDLDEMEGLETIVMVGYPNGLWDKVNNLPIFRKGVLASDYKYDWNGKKEFLIDAACFPGSSGSPVLLFDVGSYQTRNGLFVGSRIMLLGVLYAGPQHTIQGDIQVVTVPTLQKQISVAAIPNNLGIVIKSSQLNVFEGMLK
ncbi:S1 family peptidase [Thiobaca trueperi]|uniref:Trypsin-like peptidase n=1 Tax=Thiobaca trueperi TaxID=127458 RepID=A0A4R3N6Y1_9GAMM|nr:serine protease [Thiobaca trueperi]TCT24247.1 trypsin-like peptidase [Thiobaca trueperi]